MSTLPCGNRASCTDSTPRRSDGSRGPGIIQPAGPRAGPHRSGCLVTGCDTSAFTQPPGPRTGSGAAELRITRVFPCVARGFKALPAPASCSQVAAGGDRWLLMAVRGHLGGTRSGMRSPGSRWSRRHRSRQQRPERICAHGSGGGMSHVSNLRTLPAWTRSFILCPAKVIPRIFRIMDPSAVTARSLQGMARVRSGQAQAWPLVLTGVSAVVSRGQARFRVYVDR
jgi:hypothetical protein